MKKVILLTCVLLSFASAYSQNVGVGTASPGTKLDVNGALTLREGSLLISTGATSGVIPTGYTQVLVTGSPGGAFTLSGPTTPTNAGQQLIIYNNTVGGYAASFHGTGIPNGTAMEFIYSSGNWVATASGGGSAGPTGPTGTAGTNGTNGTAGATGPAGAAGTNGTNGTNGTDGATGPTGAQGPQGPTGTAGTNGTNGTDGATGATGAQGVAGPTGAAGTNGTNGTNGADGATGATGAQGIAGPTGAAGTNGTNGTNGATGAAGTNGTNGADGATGATGAQGIQGVQGNAGPTGATGSQGIQGNVGPTGPAPSGTGIVVVSGGTLGTPGTLTGDVTTTGSGLATTLAGIQGKTLAISSLAVNNILQYNGTNWINVTPASIVSGGITNSLTQSGGNLTSLVSGASSTVTPALTGDVSGGLNSTSVDKLKGTALSITSLTSGNLLQYNGTNWINVTPASVVNAATTHTLSLSSNTLTSTVNGVAPTQSLSGLTLTGDANGTLGATTVDKLKGTAMSITSLTSGNVLQYNGTNWVNAAPSSFGVTTFSAGTTGLTPSSATSGAVTLGGTLAIANGGTGTTSTTQGGIVYGASTTAYGTTAAGTAGQILQSNGTGAPTWAAPASFADWTKATTPSTSAGKADAQYVTGNVGIGDYSGANPPSSLSIKNTTATGTTRAPLILAQNSTGFQNALNVGTKDNIVDIAADYTGSVNNSSLTFSTNPSAGVGVTTERMRVNYDGAIIIGSGEAATPSGNSSTPGNTLRAPNAGAANTPGANLTVSAGWGTGTANGGSAYLTGGSTSTGSNGNAYVRGGNTGSNWGAAYVNDLGGNTFLNNSGGVVTVGSSTPGNQTVTINNASAQYSGSETATHGLSVLTGTASTDYILYMGADKTNALGYIQAVHYATAVATLGLNPRGGFVGMGLQNPQNPLHIQQTNTTDFDIVRIDGSNTTGAAIKLNSTGSGGHAWEMISTATAAGEGADRFVIKDATSATDRLIISNTGQVNIPNLGTTASAVYVDASSNLTTSAPSTGNIGYWNRTGTTLSPITAGDNITTTGAGTFGSSSNVALTYPLTTNINSTGQIQIGSGRNGDPTIKATKSAWTRIGGASGLSFWANGSADVDDAPAVHITSTGALSFGSGTNYGTAGQILQSNANTAPSWVTPSSFFDWTKATTSGTSAGKADNQYVTGNVGIGDFSGSSPAARFHVYTTTSGDGIMIDAPGTVNPGLLFGTASVQKAAIGLATTAGSWSTDAAAGDLVMRSNSSQKVVFNTNAGTSTSTMVISGSNVGIGTTAPSTALVAAGASVTNAGVLKIGTTGNTAGNQWWLGFDHGVTNTASTSADANDRARMGVNIATAGSGRLFFTTGVGGSQTQRMFIDENGYVGVGVTALSTSGGASTAAAPLDVRTTATAGTGAIMAQFGASTTTGRIQLYDENTASTLGPIINFAAGNVGQIKGSGNLSLMPTGNVGVGTTTPQTTLEVSGGVQDLLKLTSTTGGTGNHAYIDFETFSGNYVNARVGAIDMGTNNGGLVFETGNQGAASTVTTERMRILNTGAVAFNGATNYGTAGNTLMSNGNGVPTWNALNLAGGANYVSGILPIANGGTGSSTQGWVDLTTTQTAAGAKTWSNTATFNNSTYSALFTGGNVGIGNSTPALTLDVQGSMGIKGAAWDHIYLTHDGATGYIRTGGAETGGLSLQVSNNNSLAYGAQTYTNVMNLLSTGAVAFNGAGNYGTTGNQLFSNGNAAPTWSALNLAGGSNYVSGILPVGNGGTGSTTQNWVDLTTAQSAGGVKTWTSNPNFSGGAINLTNGTSNMVTFGTAVGAPTYTSTSVGTRLQLYPAETGSSVDWSLGITNGQQWYAVSQAISGHAHVFYGGTSELMRIRGDGNVGIGTTGPSQKLHVYTTTSGDGVMVDGNTNVGLMLATGGTQKGAFGYAQTSGAWSTDAAVGDVVLRSSSSQKLILNTNGGTGSSTMYLTGSNVNIPGLAVNSAVYTDASHNLTTSAPSGGAYWATVGNAGTTPTAYLDNSTAQANNYIGTNDNQPLEIYTNAATLTSNRTDIKLYTSTSTGAAVTAPSDIMHIRRNGTSSVNYPQVASFALGKYGSTINSETQLAIKLGAAGTYVPDVTVMTMNANGTVGIGNTSPGNNLLNVSSSATNSYGINLAAQAGSGGNSGGSVTIASGTNGPSSNGGGAGSINIAAANAASSSFGVNGGTVNISAGSAYNAGGSGAGGSVNITAGGNQLGANSYGNINFYTYAGSGTATSQAMFINGSNNNVGIGTTSTAATLHVAGTGIYTGTLYVNSAGTSTSSGTGTVQIGDGQITKSFGSGFVMNSTLSVATGYQIGGGAASGQYLRGNGTYFQASTIPASDLSAGISGSTGYHAKFTGANTVGSSGVIYETGSTIGINTTTTSGAISFATSGTNNISWGAGPYTSIYDNGNVHYYTDDATNFESGATGTSAKFSWNAGVTATGTGGSTWMTLTNGLLGIGTASPTQALDVNGNITLASSGGNKQIYTWNGTDANWRIGMSNSPGFTRALCTSHVEYLTYANGAGQGFAVGDNVSGLSSFEVASSGSSYQAYFRGNVGIGNASPSYPLDVSATASFANSGYGFLNGSGSTGYGSGSSGSVAWSIHSAGRIWTAEVDVASDRRIKTDINAVQSASMLDRANALRVVNYTYIDKLLKGKNNKTGFIAQEVEEVMPDAIAKSVDVIPSVFAAAEHIELHGSTLTITTAAPHGFVVGDNIVLYDCDNSPYNTQVSTITNAHTFVVQNWKGPDTEDLFVYGKKVDDFRTVDFDQITALSVGAIQELSKQVKAEKEKNLLLEQKLSELQSKSNATQSDVDKLKASIEILQQIVGAKAQK